MAKPLRSGLSSGGTLPGSLRSPSTQKAAEAPVPRLGRGLLRKPDSGPGE